MNSSASPRYHILQDKSEIKEGVVTMRLEKTNNFSFF